MEAWSQYKAFSLPQRPEQKESVPPSTSVSPLIATSTSPFASTATTLRGDLTDGEKRKTGHHAKDNASPPPTPFQGTPPPVTNPEDQRDQSIRPNEKPSRSEPTYVAFLPSDPLNPQNWSSTYKAWVVFLLTFLTLSLTFASSASSAAETGVMAEFGCGQVAATATTGVFLVGMGLGAMPAAPLSELYGRLPVYVVTIAFASVFELASAFSPNITALLIFRFIAGLLSSAPISNAGGTLNDIGNPVLRTIALPVFTSCGFIGPTLGPIIGGFLANSRLGWRWCFYVCAIWNGLAFLAVTAFMPETLSSALLKYKALRLRSLTGDKNYRAKAEDEDLKSATVQALKRPFVMLAVEPVVQFFIIYLTVVYIVLYGSFSAYPVIFAAHGISPRHIGLTFIPVMVGFILLVGLAYLHYLRYRRLYLDAKAGKQRRGIWNGKVEPEERLVPVMVVNILFPAGMFWLAFTSPAKYNVWLTMMSGLPFGIGLLSIFQATMQYNIDAYGPFASSALAGSTLVRYGVPGLVILGFPAMYEKLGTKWATALFGFLGLLLTPVPFAFYFYGRRIRARCRFTVRD